MARRIASGGSARAIPFLIHIGIPNVVPRELGRWSFSAAQWASRVIYPTGRRARPVVRLAHVAKPSLGWSVGPCFDKLSMTGAGKPEPATENTHAFTATLPRHERRLAGRLEGFGDIVFGFAVSQCALQLPVSGGYVELTAKPFGLFLYFATFAILASLWLNYHRLMSGAFRPAALDLFLAFAYLALVSLMPFAAFAITHHAATLASARVSVATYAGIYAPLSAITATVYYRNLRRGWYASDSDERDRTWRGFLRALVLTVLVSAALFIDLTAGPSWGGFTFFAIPIAIRVLRARYPHAPRAERLGIPPAS